MITLIKYSDYMNMPWKNNCGSTLQIDVEKSEKYLWRLSAAKIKQESFFSEFSDYDRLLTVWQGDGLILNDFELLPNQIFKFKGEDLIRCKPIESDVIDLGFIFDRHQIQADMKILNTHQNQGINCESALTFLFCAEGQFKVQNITVQQGDTLKIESLKPLQIDVQTLSAKIIQLKVVRIE
jgi:uncharacterized protein